MKKFIAFAAAVTLLACCFGASAENASSYMTEDTDSRLYRITVSGKTLAAWNPTDENGASLWANAAATQPWLISMHGDGTFAIINPQSGRAVSVRNSSLYPGARATLLSADGGDNRSVELIAHGCGYELRFRHSGLCLTLKKDGFTQEKFVGGENQLFNFEYAGDGAMRNLRESDGFKALGELGARFEAYIYDSRAFTDRIYIMAAKRLEEEGYFEKSADEQEAILRSCLKMSPYDMVCADEVQKSDVSFIIGDKTYIENYDVWHGETKAVWSFAVKMSDGQQINVYTTEEDGGTVKTAAGALARFPLSTRKQLRRIIQFSDGANSCNGGEDTIWIRLESTPNENELAEILAHELGHVLDINFTADNAVWESAVMADGLPVSGYGGSRTEDLAEFAALYFMTAGSEALAKVYPNRTKAFRALLYAADRNYYAEFEADYDETSPFEREAEEYYTVLCENGALTALNNTDTDGEGLIIAENRGSDGQLWQILGRKDGTAALVNKATGYCLRLRGGRAVTLKKYGGADDAWEISVSDAEISLKNGEKYLAYDGAAVVLSENRALWRKKKINVDEK